MANNKTHTVTLSQLPEAAREMDKQKNEAELKMMRWKEAKKGPGFPTSYSFL